MVNVKAKGSDMSVFDKGINEPDIIVFICGGIKGNREKRGLKTVLAGMGSLGLARLWMLAIVCALNGENSS
ncbi:MAG TPA: hypothetical protein DDY13_19985 [Cytophagales bacterium]|jgi:hypothetical protein|nr:hypothetical protein [Cytophagales bacterium]